MICCIDYWSHTWTNAQKQTVLSQTQSLDEDQPSSHTLAVGGFRSCSLSLSLFYFLDRWHASRLHNATSYLAQTCNQTHSHTCCKHNHKASPQPELCNTERMTFAAAMKKYISISKTAVCPLCCCRYADCSCVISVFSIDLVCAWWNEQDHSC